MYSRIANPFSHDLCQLTERSHDFGARRPRVYLILSALGSVEFEKTLVEVLREVLSKSRCTLVCCEAANGDASRPSGWITDALAESQLNGGLLHATEYLQVRGELDFLLWGVDDMALHQQAAEIMLRHRGEIKVWSELIGEVRQRGTGSLLDRVIEAAHLPAEWEEILVADSGSRVADMIRLAREKHLDIPPLLDTFSQSMEMEERIDFARANQEAEVLFRQLLSLTANASHALKELLERGAPEKSGQFLTSEAFESVQSSPVNRLISWHLRQTGKHAPENGDQLAAAFFEAARHLWQEYLRLRQAIPDSLMREGADPSVAAVAGHIGQLADSFSFLVDLLPLLGLDSGKVPNVVLYVRSLRPVSVANLADVFPLLDELQQRLIDRLTTPPQRKCVKLAKRLQLMKEIVALRATTADLARILNDPMMVDHAQICAQVKATIGEHPLTLQFERLREQYQSSIEDVGRWVRIHAKRSETMAEKTLAKMAALGLTQAVLLVGGFHEAPIVSLLLAREVSCIGLRAMVKHAASEQEWDTYLGFLTAPYDHKTVQ